MAKKTNKTSHVMDLLTNGASSEVAEPAGETPSPSQEKKSDVQSHTVTPAKVTVVDEGSRNDRLSQEILGKLTEELEEETRLSQSEGNADIPDPIEMAPLSEALQDHFESSESDEEAERSTEETSSENAAVPENSTELSQNSHTAEPIQRQEVSQDSPEDDSPQHQEPSNNIAQTESVFHDQPLANGPVKKEIRSIFPQRNFITHAQDNAYQFLNVMEQVLMRQDLEAVLTQHGVCTCPRCMSDVCALVLTGLPSKYVVTDRDSISPLISYYENKYKIPILTQLMMACAKVRERPRHKKE